MKKYASKILAGAIALTMILGNFTGMGASEVKAAFNEISIYVEDEDMEPIEDIYLKLKNTSGGNDIIFGPTDETGKAIYKTTGKDIGNYILEPTEESGYVASDEVEINITSSGIEIVGSGYAQAFLTVEGGAEKPEIYTATSSSTEISREGGMVKVTVAGTALPGTLFYRILYMKKSEESVIEEKLIKVEGAAGDKKTFNVVIPAVAGYPEALAWKIQVAITSNDYWTSTDVIAIKKDTVTAETKVALQSAINEMNSLPESDYTAKSWGSYKAAIDAAKPLLTKPDATNTECQAAIQAIEKAKAALILKKNLAAESTKDALRDAVNGTEGYRGSDYTATSWKAFSVAIAKAKTLLGNADATETQCQEAIREIERTKAALVTAKVNISEITVSGMSKSIAVGKTIQLTAKISPADATNKTVKWTSSNKKYAAVDSKGKVSVKKAGAGKTVTITAAAADGSGKKATYKIKIMKNSVKSIKLKAAKSVKAGKSIKVKATVKTTGKKANKALKWTSSNRQYAAVTSKGAVKTKKAGKGKKVKITAMATDGSNKKKTVTIKIK